MTGDMNVCCHGTAIRWIETCWAEQLYFQKMYRSCTFQQLRLTTNSISMYLSGLGVGEIANGLCLYLNHFSLYLKYVSVMVF